jgi:glycosyltransferase involved in cell wall biosynthesis
MKIAVIAQGQIPSQAANSIQNMKMSQALAGLGHAVRVFAPGEDPGVAWEQIAAHYGLERRFELRWLPARAAFRRYDFAFSALGKAQDWSAELIYTRLPQAAALASARGLQTIFELHDMPSGTMGPFLMKRFLQGSGARRVVVNTQRLADAVTARYVLPKQADFLTLVPNGVDLARYANLPEPAAARKQLGLSEGFTAGYSGHLYEGRGIELILELAQRLPQMQFVLVGGRENDLQRVKTQAANLQNVRLVGFVPNAELPLYQAAADVLLMPYGKQVAASSGGDIAQFVNPMKMFEYMASLRPILSSDLPVIREVLNAENAVILPGDDAEAWAAALQGLQADAGRRSQLAAAGRKTVEQFTWEKRAQRILQGL